MEIFIKAFHILVSFALIFVVLLQSGKGASMGAAFGGSSSNALFGSTGSNNFMTKLTTFVAILFIITCLSLAYMSSHMATSSLMSDVQTQETPIPVEAVPGTPADMPPPVDAGAEIPGDHPPMDAGVPATEAPATPGEATEQSQH